MSRSRTQLQPIALQKKLPQFASMSQPDARLALLGEIERLAKQAKQLNLADSAFILSVAHLDLKSRIHDVSDEEIHAISQIIPPHA